MSTRLEQAFHKRHFNDQHTFQGVFRTLPKMHFKTIDGCSAQWFINLNGHYQLLLKIQRNWNSHEYYFLVPYKTITYTDPRLQPRAQEKLVHCPWVTRILLAALFLIAKNWTKYKYPSTEKQDILWYNYTMDHYQQKK